MQIIVFTGKQGSGKTTETERVAKEYKSMGYTVACMSFADPIKALIRDEFYLTKESPLKILNDIEVTKVVDPNKVSERVMGKINLIVSAIYGTEYMRKVSEVKANYDWETFADAISACHLNKPNSEIYKKSIRFLYQQLGTEITRGINKDIWAKFTILKLRALSDSLLFKNTVVIIDDLKYLNELAALVALDQEIATTNLYIQPLKIADEIRAQRLGLTKQEMEIKDKYTSEFEVELTIKASEEFMRCKELQESMQYGLSAQDYLNIKTLVNTEPEYYDYEITGGTLKIVELKRDTNA